MLRFFCGVSQLEKNYQIEELLKDKYCGYDHVNNIEHEKYKVTVLEHDKSDTKHTVNYGRRRWMKLRIRALMHKKSMVTILGICSVRIIVE